MLIKVLFFITFFTSSALAAGGDIPVAFIKLQLMNFIVFGAVIFFVSRSKVAPVFKQIRDDYIAESQEAKRKLEEALAQRDSLLSKLNSLDSDFDATLAKATEDAGATYKTKIMTAKDTVSAMNKDLESQIKGLQRSQTTALKTLLMEQSIEELKADLNGDVDEALLLQLQDQFVKTVDMRA